MATLKVEALPREFYFNGTRIPDPAPQMTAEEIRDLLTPSYPEIATATLTGPEDTGAALRYSFSRAIGSKGRAVARRSMTKEELAALFMAKAAEAPPAVNLILARHLQSKESCDLSNAVAEATRCYAGTDRTLLPAPPDLLPPLA